MKVTSQLSVGVVSGTSIDQRPFASVCGLVGPQAPLPTIRQTSGNGSPVNASTTTMLNRAASGASDGIGVGDGGAPVGVPVPAPVPPPVPVPVPPWAPPPGAPVAAGADPVWSSGSSRGRDGGAAVEAGSGSFGSGARLGGRAAPAHG